MLLSTHAQEVKVGDIISDEFDLILRFTKALALPKIEVNNL